MLDIKYLGISKKYYPYIAAALGFYFAGIIGGIASFFLVRELIKNKSGKVSYDLALLKISTFLIKSDGKVDPEEIQFVRAFFIKNFGNNRANFLFKEIKKIETPTTLEENCRLLSNRLTTSQYYSVLQFLFALASSDGKISKAEDNIIYLVGINLGFTDEYINTIRNQFINFSSSKSNRSLDDKYLLILGLKKDATGEDIKNAYRKLAKEYHPDKLIGMSEGIIKLAKEKFQEINEAYEYLNKNYV